MRRMLSFGRKRENWRETFDYPESFFISATDKELSYERERVRQRYCNAASYNFSSVEADRLYWLLQKFDRVIRERNYGDAPTGFPKHTYHGWYLPDDD